MTFWKIFKRKNRLKIDTVMRFIRGGLKNNLTRESRGLAGEPKHFPFAIVFIFIIKSTLTLPRGFP